MVNPIKLVILDEEHGRLEFSTAAKRLRVGRAEGLDISRPNDSLISNRHCVITDGVLFDKGSTNGTYLNGNLVPHETNTELKIGDTLAVGNTLIKVEAAEEDEPEEVAMDSPAEDMFLVIQGRKYFLPAQTVSIGRQPSNSIVLDDKLVSGNHCAIINGELLDERSTNGTFVNAQQVPYCLEQKLSIGDRVRVGEMTLTVVAATEDEVARWHAEGGTNDNASVQSKNAAFQLTLQGEIPPVGRTVAFADEQKDSDEQKNTDTLPSQDVQAAAEPEQDEDDTSRQQDDTHTSSNTLEEPGKWVMSVPEDEDAPEATEHMLGSMSEPVEKKNAKKGGFGLGAACVLVALASAGFFVYKHFNDMNNSDTKGSSSSTASTRSS